MPGFYALGDRVDREQERVGMGVTCLALGMLSLRYM